MTEQEKADLPYQVTPEDAIDAARREVKAWRMEKPISGSRRAQLDPLTEWFVLAWDTFSTPPGNRLELLRGDRAGQHSIRINDQFRLCFRWSDSGPEDVEIVDYH